MSLSPGEPPPRINSWLLSAFTWNARRYVRKHFHSVRLLQGADPSTELTRGTLVYMNHPSWWDPMIALLVANRFFPDWRHYCVFEENALRKYEFFRKMGAIGVDHASAASVRNFVRVSRSVLSVPGQAFWVTPQGAFRDARERPTKFKPGLELLARRLPGFDFLPLAIEYPFWDERLPEALLAFGESTPSETIAQHGAGELIETLTATQDRLAEAAVAREAGQFRPLEFGAHGVGGVYDQWRRWSRWLQGKSFSTRHGDAP